MSYHPLHLSKKYLLVINSIISYFILSAFCVLTINAEEAETLSVDDTMTGEVQHIKPYVKEKIKDWSLKCVAPQISFERCEANQIIFNKKQQPVAEISIFKLPKDQIAAAAATILVPLETILSEGLILAIQDLEPKKYQYKFCNSLGCYSQIGLTYEEVEALKNKGEASIVLKHKSSGDQQIVIPMSLAGFTQTFSNVTQP